MNMEKRKAIVLAALVAALCSACALPVRDAGDGVYYAESPPDYVYADYGPFSWSFYSWMGPMYPYPPYSSWYTQGSRWFHPPYGIPDWWAVSSYDWHAPRVYPAVSSATRGPAHAGDGKLRGVPPQARYATAAPSSPSAKQGKVRTQPAFGAAPKPGPRSAPSSRSMGAAPPPRSRPARASRPMPSPKPMRIPAPRDID